MAYDFNELLDAATFDNDAEDEDVGIVEQFSRALDQMSEVIFLDALSQMSPREISEIHDEGKFVAAIRNGKEFLKSGPFGLSVGGLAGDMSLPLSVASTRNKALQEASRRTAMIVLAGSTGEGFSLSVHLRLQSEPEMPSKLFSGLNNALTSAFDAILAEYIQFLKKL